MTLVLLAGALAGAALAADASSGTTTIYRWVDAKGVVHYTDSPQPGAQQLHVAPAQTYRPPPVQNQPQADPASATVSPYQVCRIDQPTSQQSLYAPEQVVVNIQLVPQLRAGDQLTATMDGRQLQPADNSGVDFAIQAPYRGAHTVSAIVHDPSGRTLCRAPPVTFYVRRPSLLSPQSPARVHRPQPAPSTVTTAPGAPLPAPPAPPPAPPPLR